MRTRQKIVTLMILATLLLVTSGVVLAQEEPPTAADETIALTWTALTGLIGVALTVGLGGGIAGALLFIRAVNQNEPLKLAIEKLYLSASPDTQRLIRGGVVLGRETFHLADELTDGVLPGEHIPGVSTEDKATTPVDPSGQ